MSTTQISQVDADLLETSPASGRVFERKPTIAYALVENADVYQRIMRVFYENKRVLGPRLTENDVAARLWQQFAFELEPDALGRHLDQLVAWHALDRQHDPGHARNLDDFKRRRHNYAITQAGELAERFLDDLDNLRERVGALEGSRLQAILAELGALVRELETGEPDPQRLRTALDNLRAELEALDQGASDFMAQLANVLASSEAVNDDSFLAYKDRVIRYLTGFASEFRRSAQRIEEQATRLNAPPSFDPTASIAATVASGVLPFRPELRPDSITRFVISFVCSGSRASRSTSMATCLADSPRIRFPCIGAPFRCRGQGVAPPLAHFLAKPRPKRTSVNAQATKAAG